MMPLWGEVEQRGTGESLDSRGWYLSRCESRIPEGVGSHTSELFSFVNK